MDRLVAGKQVPTAPVCGLAALHLFSDSQHHKGPFIPPNSHMPTGQSEESLADPAYTSQYHCTQRTQLSIFLRRAGPGTAHPCNSCSKYPSRPRSASPAPGHSRSAISFPARSISPYSVQFSSSRPGTRSTFRILFVTSKRFVKGVLLKKHILKEMGLTLGCHKAPKLEAVKGAVGKGAADPFTVSTF